MDAKSSFKSAKVFGSRYGRKAVKPVVLTTLAIAAISGFENRHSIADTLDPSPVKVSGEIVPGSTKPMPELPNFVDNRTEIMLPAGFSVKMLVCEEVGRFGKECFEESLFITEKDVEEGKAKIDENTLIVNEDLVERGLNRPWEIIHRER